MPDIRVQDVSARTPIIDGVGRPDKVFLKFLNQVRRRVLKAPQIVDAPASAGADGTPGQIAYDADYLYVCVDTDTWKRTGLSTW